MTTEQTTIQTKTIDWRWQAVETKNREFDGAFYFGVRTTGVFCRPSCSSKPPKRENVSFFITPAEAEQAGYRECLRCLPKSEYFPGAAAKLIQEAFELLRSNEDEIATVDELCAHLDV